MAIYTVTNTNDSGAGSLRQAILDAAGTSGADTIKFAAKLSGKTIHLASTLQIVSGNDVSFDGDLDGDGVADVSLSGDTDKDGIHESSDLGVLLKVASGSTANINGIKFVDAVADSSAVSDGSQAIAGVSNYGTLTISRSEFSDMEATGAFGASAGGDGGRAVAGILNDGSQLTVSDTIFENMKATGGGGAFGTTLGGDGGHAIAGIYNPGVAVSLLRSAVRESHSYGGSAGPSSTEGGLAGSGVTGAFQYGGQFHSQRFGAETANSDATNGFNGSSTSAGTIGIQILGGASYTYNTLTDPEIGTTGVDVVSVANGKSFLGFAGNDQISNASGGGVLYGQGGNDTLISYGAGGKAFGGRGSDQVNVNNGANGYGGAGDDIVWVTNLVAGTVLDGGKGTDLLDIRQNSGNSFTFDLQLGTGGGCDIVRFENMVGMDDADHFDTILGTNGANQLFGMKGDDVLRGRAGDDALAGGDGDDKINGDKGNDLLVGDKGIDRINGGANNDTIGGGVGNDILNGNGGKDTIAGGGNNDRIKGGAGKDLLGGGSGSDLISGGGGNDEIHGQGGKDEVSGGGGNDKLLGGGGNDQIKGNAGADTLFGQDGNDKLTGGKGKDKFAYGKGWDKDVATDFNMKQDTLLFDKKLKTTKKMSVKKFVETFAELNAKGDAVFDFGGGNEFKVKNVGDLTHLHDNVEFG